MRSVLISIRPKWCELIANGKKTIEVRKTRPKLETPFKCYIYCTKDSKAQFWKASTYSYLDNHSHNAFDKCGNGKVIGEFVCDTIKHFDSAFDEYARSTAPGGSIINSMGWKKFLEVVEKKARITKEELEKYFPEDVRAYLWHISELKIYDDPIELSEFMAKPCVFAASCGACNHSMWNHDNCNQFVDCSFSVKRPPQSWCYVEEVTQDD